MPGVAVVGRDLLVGYGNRPVLAASNFAVPMGSLVAVIGPNGSGKSTLLNAISGLVKPLAGSIHVFGLKPAEARPRVAYVLQATAVNQVMPVTVTETVSMGRYALLGPVARFHASDREAVQHAMIQLGLEALAGKHLHELSGGERQRVFVAQGLAQGAELLLLDEPITGLDLISRELILTALGGELTRRRTVVMATHDLAEASRADHVLLMSGRVHSEGPPQDVLNPDQLSDAYGVGIVHLEDGSIVLDDPHHRGAGRHVHFERSKRSS